MNKKELDILTFLGVKKPEELIGKTLKVSFTRNDTDDDTDDGNLFPIIVFTQISSLTLEEGEISFPYIPISGGSECLQVSIFNKKEFHLNIFDAIDPGQQTAQYYSKKSVLRTWGIVARSGKIEVI